jgi:ubiquinone/menaquinone biosynthesis C-methylase UbiE/pimeloyl-ACP methyl ester carboxylesterase
VAEAIANSARLRQLGEASLRRLHRASIEAPDEVRALLLAACSRGLTLRNGVDRRNAERTAQIISVARETLTLRVQNITAKQLQLFLNFECDGTAYFFATRIVDERADHVLASVPTTVYKAERRDLRRISATLAGQSTQVELAASSESPRLAQLRDWSYDGLGVVVPEASALETGTQLFVRFLDGSRAGSRAAAVVRNSAPDREKNGWTRLGLSVSAVPMNERIRAESRARILPQGVSTWQKIVLVGRPVQGARHTIAARFGRSRSVVEPNIVEFSNQLGQRLVGILDRTHRECETAVVIPPSWGRTKETFLPLAKTISRMFSAAGESIAVLRFDGSNRRGESYIDPGSRSPGDEYLGFTFSQAVKDIHASVAYLNEAVHPKRTLLVTFSLAAVEGRRAVATDASGTLGGWISVVGMPDLQSGLRSVSGGVDYAHGLLEGVEFGLHELVGVTADMDRTGTDALHHQLVFLEDARRDMAAITVPVTWLHGRHDGWIDLDRVATLMSSGDLSNRRLIEIPTGHELRTSIEALETFQLIGSEIGRIATGGSLKPMLPNLALLERSRAAERKRRPVPDLKPASFWRDYLIGKRGDGGMQILTASSAYRRFMADQIEALRIRSDTHLVDLGSGLGELTHSVERTSSITSPTRITELDIVTEVLKRSRARTADRAQRPFSVSRVAADLDSRAGCIPFKSGSADAVLASLMISYLPDPAAVLREVLRILVPNGRLVVSSMRRDADISRIHAEGVAELQASAPSAMPPSLGLEGSLDVVQREFLNSASKLIDLEESGRFQFFDGAELDLLLRTAGFVDITVTPSFGDPPQAIIAACRRP